MIPMRLTLLIAAALAAPAWAAAEMPDISITSDGTTGNGYRAWDGKGRVDFGDRPDWSLNGSFSWTHDHGSQETLSKQVALGFEHTPDDNWSYRGTLTGWRDYILDTRYFGPSWGVSYYINEAPTHSDAPPPMNESISNEDKDEAPPPPKEFLGFSFDNDLFFYHIPETTAAQTIKVKGKKPVKVPAGLAADNLSQWHPNFTVEKPLFGQIVVPSLEIGHYFYSGDPGVIESRAGAPRFGTGASGMSSTAGGLFKNDGTAALDVKLPWHCRLHGSLGAAQSATDNTWAISQELAFKTTVAGRVSVRGKWDHTIQGGSGTDLYTGTLTLLF